MNNSLFEDLSNQTAPESTRGLFDPPIDKKSNPQNSAISDKRRSLGIEQSSHRSSSFQIRGHQRSRSASASDFTFNNNRRNNLALQTLVEEEVNQRKKQDGDIDSLANMISTLKNMPPIISPLDPSVNKPHVGHRKQQSMSSLSNTGENTQVTSNKRLSYNKTNAGPDMQSSNNFQTRNRSKRSQTVSNGSSDGFDPRRDLNIFNSLSRDEALAEAEAKLTGSFQKGKEPTKNNDSSNRRSSMHSYSFSSRRYSESNQPLDLNLITKSTSSSLLNKHTSLQMPPLNENEASDSVSNRRITFNKPLNLSSSNKSLVNEPIVGGQASGHQRRLSRNLDSDWRTSANSTTNTANQTNNRNSFQIVPFTPTRVNFSRDDANPHQRRPLFVAHLPFSALPPLFRYHQLYRGLLRVNKRNRSDAYVYCEDLDDDIYICGSRDRNRALEGDVVAVKLVDVDKVLFEKKEKEEIKLARNGGQIKIRLPDDEDENEVIFGGDDDVNVIKPKFCGVVVAILERAQNQVFSGTLTLMRPNNKRAEEEKAAEQARKLIHGKDTIIQKEAPRIVWFKATDKRVPLIAIPIEQAPKDFVNNSEMYSDRLFVGSMKRWPITSLHPFGSLERELGVVVDMSTQTKAILADNNVTDNEFSDVILSCLPSIPFNLVTDETRRDLRENTFAFTIDPKGSNVLDDALSIKKLDEDYWEVGVHVSDIGYFIKSHSALDKEARSRAVRVDLTHTHVPMLPELLTEQITNLSLDKPRLAVSVIWKIDNHGTIVDTWFGKTIVKSSAQLTYDEAQDILNNPKSKSPENRLITDNILSIYSLYNILRNKRLSNGFLTQIYDELDYEFEPNNQEEPVTVSMHRKTTAELMVKEFLYLANKSVAQKISSGLPSQALLRRQAPPNERKIKELQSYALQHLRVQLDITSAGALESSIQSIQDIKLRKLVSVIVLNTMQPPKYFCSGYVDVSKYSHYSLNTPIFTHFTAPSRRFSDIVVHRQLEAVLSSGENKFSLDRDTVQKLAQHCNVKKEAAINARKQSKFMFLTKHMSKLAEIQRQKQSPNTTEITNAMFREAIIIAVFEQYFDVIIPELNIAKRIHLASLPVWRSDYNQNNRTLTMFWRKGVDTSTGESRGWDVLDEEDEEDIDEEALLEEMNQNSSNPSSPQGSDEEDYKYKSALFSDKEVIVSQLAIKGQEKFEKSLNIKPSKSVSTPLISNPIPEKTRSSNRRASIVRARLSDSTAFNTEQGYQTIKAMDKIRVVLISELLKTPPIIKVLAANPFS